MAAKDQVDYWRTRVVKRRSASGREVSGYCAQILSHGIRRWYNTGSSNKHEAAQRVRDFWVAQLRDHGWPEKETEPESVPDQTPTIGSYLKAVDTTGAIAPKTLKDYARKLRTLAAHAVLHLPTTTKGRTHADWYAKVDAVPLRDLTTEATRNWRRNRIGAAGSDATAIRSAHIACNSILRSCAALFRPLIAEAIGVEIPPDCAWAHGKKERLEQTRSPRYVSRIDASTLFSSAKTELKKKDPDAYKVILLALGAGLRRSEIDRLRWQDVDTGGYRIHVKSNEAGVTKSLSSEGVVHVAAELIHELGTGTGWIVSPDKNKPAKPYRADTAMRAATSWLRSQGVQSNCPLHTLRKEFGSVICSRGDIYAASVQLRHSSIQVTRDHYLAPKSWVVMPLK